MRRQIPWAKVTLATGLAIAGMVGPASRATAVAPTLTAVRGQLRLLFADWDLNGDGYLDKEELAKAFRGPSAKPFDSPKPAKKDGAGAEIKGGGKDKKPDYKSYPDYLFLTQLDENDDKRISKKEWETWAKDYARGLRDFLKAQDQVQKAKARLDAATTLTSRRRALSSMRRYQKTLLALQKKQMAMDKKIYQAMTVVGKR
jgi:hypothetical protein